MAKSICDNCSAKNCLWRAETGSIDPPVMDCENFNKMVTYAEKIRSMTDEELADWLYNHDYCPYCESYYGNKDREVDCKAVILEWLKKEG